MDFLELAADRYSVRKFKNQSIEEEKPANLHTMYRDNSDMVEYL